MKTYIITTALLVISFLGFSQVTPSGHFRIANRTTSFGINIPVGTEIYCILDSTTWEARVGIASSATITTAINSLILVGRGTNLSVGTVTSTTVDVNSSTGASVTLPAATGTNAGLMTAPEFINLSNQSGTNTGNQTLTIGGGASPTIALSGSNTATFAGAGITSVNQSGGTITITSTEVDGSVTNEGSLSVTDTTNGAHIISNTSGSAPVTLSGGTGLSITRTGTTITLNTTGLGTRYIAEAFEEATGGTNRTYTLGNTPHTATTGITVMLNGMALKPTAEYTSSALVVTVSIPVYQYDHLVISYTY